MGGCISFSCDSLVSQLSNWTFTKAKIIRDLKENIPALETSLIALKAARDDLVGRVEREERFGSQQRLHQVQVWIESADTLHNEVIALLNSKDEQLQRLCADGLCSRNPRKSYVFSKEVSLKLADIETLRTSVLPFFQFQSSVTQPTTCFQHRPVNPTIVGRESVLENAWNHLIDDGVGIVGLHGMGGVGKTTLLTEINNRLLRSSDHYDFVLWIGVSQNSQPLKIINDIGARLGLSGEQWHSREETDKAIQIYNLLRTRRFVLLLDDIWTKVDLAEIGVPVPTTGNRCKIAFTTRSLDVCACMGVRDPIEIPCLAPDKAFELFIKKVGEQTLQSDPQILNLASKVAERCCGLPLALNVIGETMASKKTVQEWKHAVDVLTNYASEFLGMEDVILPMLKFSYDNLKGERIKSCFKYLAIYPDSLDFHTSDLIMHWISEGFIDDSMGIERAQNEGRAIIETLLRASLLMKISTGFVRPHDVIRDLALWLLRDCGKFNNRVVVGKDMSLHQMRALDWETVTWMSISGSSTKKIDVSPECPNLSTLILWDFPHLETIPDNFFQFMPKLAALHLTCLTYLKEFPDMSHLVSLKSLSLLTSTLRHLPIGLLELTTLKYLDLSFTSLESLAGISKLSGLKLLWLGCCQTTIDISIVEELALLEHLEDLTINICKSSTLEKLLSFPRLANVTTDLGINYYKEPLALEGYDPADFMEPWELDLEASRNLILWNVRTMEKLRALYMDTLDGLETKIVENLRTECFPNLTTVYLKKVKRTRDLNWLLYAPNLTVLEVTHSPIEEVISASAGDILPFGKLKKLKLAFLEELTSIYRSPLQFRFLKLMAIECCPKLKRLPLNSESVGDLEGVFLMYSPGTSVGDIEWEDEATKQRFLPLVNLKAECKDWEWEA